MTVTKKIKFVVQRDWDQEKYKFGSFKTWLCLNSNDVDRNGYFKQLG